jgi:chromosome segregation ATPase
MSRDNRSNSYTVQREKYEVLKEKANQWKNRCEKLVEKLSVVQDVEDELDRLEEKCRTLENKNEELKKSGNNNPDNDLLDELETENKAFRKEIRILKRENKELSETNKTKIVQLERDILLKDGKIQRLDETKKDLKDRYTELKEDFREHQRWARQPPK